MINKHFILNLIWILGELSLDIVSGFRVGFRSGNKIDS